MYRWIIGSFPSFATDIVPGDLNGTSDIFVALNPLFATAADAGPDQTVSEGDLVTLDGSGSTDDGNPLTTYEWMQIGGSPVVDFETGDPLLVKYLCRECHCGYIPSVTDLIDV